MSTVFTICSNNYLAQAKTLADSFSRLNKNYRFIIALVDSFSDSIDYHFFDPYEIIPISSMGIEQLEQMAEKYDITELNTAVKPFIFNFLFRTDPSVNSIIYLDPDILIYQPFTYLESCLIDHNIIITPHFFTPIYDRLFPSEPDVLNSGIYNLGFIAVKRSEESFKFLNWWMLKLTDQCLVDFANGLFVDQLWINFVPLYFKKVLILTHLGHNVAYWNLHERSVSHNGTHYLVNKSEELVFFHFSGYTMGNHRVISQYQNRYTFLTRPEMVPLFKEYYNLVMKNHYKKLIDIPCFYILSKNEHLAGKKKKRNGLIKNSIRNIVNKIRYPFN